MSEPFAPGPDSAWVEVTDDNEYEAIWARFDDTFGFRAGIGPESWPGIREPSPSVTFDLSGIPDGAERGAAYDAINAEALRAFVWALPDCEQMIVLNWNHAAWRFSPATQAVAWHAEWVVPVFPNGDYFAFLNPDYTEGTFGHPWEQTICVMGERLTKSLARSWATWLPIKRQDGAAT